MIILALCCVLEMHLRGSNENSQHHFDVVVYLHIRRAFVSASRMLNVSIVTVFGSYP